MGISRHSKHEPTSSEVDTEVDRVKPVVALYSCTASRSDELSFKQGDYLGIINDNDPDWWYAYHLTNQQSGYVPRNYVDPVELIGNEDWLLPKINSNEIKACRMQNCDQTSDNGKNEIHTYDDCDNSTPIVVGPLPEDQEDIEIQHDCLEIVRPIGKGNFGEVFYGYCNKTWEVALKYLPTCKINLNNFRSEFETLKKFKHLQIMRLFAVCLEKESFCMVMEYMCHGHLQQYLKSDLGKELKLPSLVNMAAQISDGMKYLESEKLIHKSLAARNILVGKGDVVKIGDFGLERILDAESYNEGRNQLFKWTSPEAFSSGEFTIKSDVWSFGVVLYEIFTHGGTPYEGKNNDEITELFSLNYRMPKPNDPECSDPVYETMLFCWKKNPEDRPTFEYLCHYFMDYEETSYKSYFWIPFPARR